MDNQNYDISVELQEAWIASIKERIQSARCPRWRWEPCTIFKIPINFRQGDIGNYEPRVISLGPFHHGKDHLKAMEKIKWRYLGKFLERRPSLELEYYLNKIKEREIRARSCYSDDYEMGSDKFVETMLLDGSFVVELLLKQLVTRKQDFALTAEEEDDPVVSSMWMLPLIQFDMIKLENQIPFFILEFLFDCVSFTRGTSLPWLSIKFFHELLQLDVDTLMEKPFQNIYHFLHLLHSRIIPPSVPKKSSVFHRFKNIFRQKIKKNKDEEEFTLPVKIYESILSISKLCEAGIKIKKKEKYCSFLDVTFRSGAMEMAPIHLYDETFSFLRNLIAFEQCYPEAGAHVACYAFLMDCLVDTTADVALLQQEGVIVNGLGSDKEVAILFNRLSKNVIVDHTTNYLSYLFHDVHKYSGSRIPTWRAKLVHDYFNNPWSFISLLAAIALLALTTTQALYAILSYIQQSHNS